MYSGWCNVLYFIFSDCDEKGFCLHYKLITPTTTTAMILLNFKTMPHKHIIGEFYDAYTKIVPK